MAHCPEDAAEAAAEADDGLETEIELVHLVTDVDLDLGAGIEAGFGLGADDLDLGTDDIGLEAGTEAGFGLEADDVGLEAGTRAEIDLGVDLDPETEAVDRGQAV